MASAYTQWSLNTVILYKLIKTFPSYFNSQKINFGTYDNYIPGKKEFNIYFWNMINFRIMITFKDKLLLSSIQDDKAVAHGTSLKINFLMDLANTF